MCKSCLWGVTGRSNIRMPTNIRYELLQNTYDENEINSLVCHAQSHDQNIIAKFMRLFEEK